jgi:hypothetical protein
MPRCRRRIPAGDCEPRASAQARERASVNTPSGVTMTGEDCVDASAKQASTAVARRDLKKETKISKEGGGASSQLWSGATHAEASRMFLLRAA